jgi:hypothetical protein
MNTGHRIWSIQTRYTNWHTDGHWYPYICFFAGHFDSLPHQWQTIALVTNRNKQQNSGGHCSSRLFVNSRHELWFIQTSYIIWHTAGAHTCASLVTFIQLLTSNKWWQKNNTSKTVVVSKESNRLFVNSRHGLWSIQTNFTIWHTAGTYTGALLVILTQFLTSDKYDSVTNRNKQQPNSGGHCKNLLFVNTGHGLWSIQTSYTIWHTAGTHTFTLLVTLTQFSPGTNDGLCGK